MRDGDRNRMGQNQLEVAFPLVTAMERKGLGIIRTIVNLSIRGAFYYTFRVKLRASAVSGGRTDPPELSLAGKTCTESVPVLRAALNSPCAQMTCGTPSAVPDWILCFLLSVLGVLSPRAELGSPQISCGLSTSSAVMKQLLSICPTRCFCSCLHSTRRFYSWGSLWVKGSWHHGTMHRMQLRNCSARRASALPKGCS